MNNVFSIFHHAAHPIRIQGNILEVMLRGVFIGEICLLKDSIINGQIIGEAIVIGFRNGITILSMMGSSQGYSLQIIVVPTGNAFSVALSPNILGSMIDINGNYLLRFNDKKVVEENFYSYLPIDGHPPSFNERRPITEIFESGVRAVDGLLSCGLGQRMGIFASAGTGKTMLMNMFIRFSQADIFVIGLIGERGREVTEFVEELKRDKRCEKTVLICSTSDQPAIERCNAALVATTVAEYFREQGKNVVLFIDSMTRYCRALRDVALTAGELPVRKGYPASVFDKLPAILERPGVTHQGSITAFYTVLLESDDEPDAIGEEIRSILDGHIYLSRKIAASGHYPAIDILGSVSRIFQQITSTEQQKAALKIRQILMRLQDIKLLQELGEYRAGENELNDLAVNKQSEIEAFLIQSFKEKAEFQKTLNQLYALTS
ncbi:MULTISPECIES: type III secretion system ATPase SctN [Morganellaceae]|uniref:type III secretion system ATPase SctN n=1 Tax=Morganellaceae TaxID=1903414 RepID=UPI000BFE6F63|nr:MULTISPECIES: type III secretion system ATPase SctN [Proteus]ATM99334.1 FliI/YscN family ATPase [Proteus vulgaris]MBG2837692.1 type III secretion system ATPase SctN [Proteus terrae subsp. cibarius]MBG2868063.1 type III secretion system ATPase SctN [Proteus terrae subsp. cibarius]MCO7051598.1 type III secretion system ATPase SctN [Proteus terrae]MCS6715917.1 type III secretion system ATPase SctN [Proteus terrae]